MGRGIRTVQRWEETLHLPVYRINSSPRSPVFAFREELDQWVQQRAKLSASGQQEFSATQEQQTPKASLTPGWFRRQRQIQKLIAEDIEQNRFRFMSIELDTALTMVKVAAGASNKQKKKRCVANARRALDQVVKHLQESNLQENEQNFLRARLAKAEAALKQIPPPAKATK
jgi:hypothetical protein